MKKHKKNKLKSIDDSKIHQENRYNEIWWKYEGDARRTGVAAAKLSSALRVLEAKHATGSQIWNIEFYQDVITLKSQVGETEGWCSGEADLDPFAYLLEMLDAAAAAALAVTNDRIDDTERALKAHLLLDLITGLTPIVHRIPQFQLTDAATLLAAPHIMDFTCHGACANEYLGQLDALSE